MKKTIRKYIRKISRRNLALPGIFLLIALALGYFIPFEEMLEPECVTSLNGIVSEAESGKKFISFEGLELTYAGYDYYKNGKVEASFYYGFTEGNENCVFFLIKEGESSESGMARIVKKDMYTNIFLKNYAADIGLGEDALTELSGGYIVSCLDYKFYAYAAMLVILALIALISVIYFLKNIFVLIFPAVHSSCRRLKKYGLSGRDFSDIDSELENDRIIEAGNMFATSHYLVVFGKGTIYMIPLFNIVWAYDYVARQIFVSRKLLSYTLVVYTSPKGRIVMRGNRKKNTDKILSFLERDFSHIAVGYSEENQEKFSMMQKRGEL